MGGISVGPKSWSFSTMGSDSQAWITDSVTNLEGWTREDDKRMIWTEERLDLRAYLQGGKGLNLLNVAIQESGPWSAIPMDVGGEPILPSWMVVDIISSVRLNIETLKSMNASNSIGYPYNYLPGFSIPEHANGQVDGHQSLNSSQIIWGMWRAFATDQTVIIEHDLSPARNSMLGERVWTSGEFGSGEVMVAPQAYYYRVIYTGSEIQLYVPAANIQCLGDTLDLKPYVELNQMARLAQR